MIEWDAYTRRLLTKGDTRKERTLNRLADKLHSEVNLHPGCVEVLINDVPQYLFTKRTDRPTKKNFNTLPGDTINLGDVVFWENRHWLVTECLSDDSLTYHGSIEQCNRKLRWQNQQTREIVERWCTIAKPYYSNLDAGLKTTVSSREFKVQLPSDYETNQLDVDQRFMMEVINGEPKVYKITSVDMNTKRFDVDGESVGFLILNIEQCQYDENSDSIEYGICGYLEPFNDLQETKMGWCVVDTTAGGISPGGVPLTLTARYFDVNGVPLPGEKTLWTVDAAPEIEDALTQDELDDHSLRLTMEYDCTLIGETFDVTAMNPTGNISHTVTVKVVNAL